jgi:hypothetical protein
MSYKFISLKDANDNKHKYIVTLLNKETGREKTIRFGAFGLLDFTLHKKDIRDKRKSNYIARHEVRENWTDPSTAGFWSRWILWNLPTISASLKDTINRFQLK